MMKPRHNHPNYYFLGLTGVALLLSGLIIITSWNQSRFWLETLWHICQAQFQQLGYQQQLLLWQFLPPIIFAVILMRGILSLRRQLRATAQLTDTFYPLREKLPSWLHPLLQRHQLTVDNLVFLNLTAPHAFCVGVLRPRIWLTSGLVELLSDAELSAVFAHEVHHLRKQDPLRLVIGRTLKSAFFFLPVMGDLAKSAELQQEVAADQAAITALGDDLPLLCALQKLMKQGCRDDDLPPQAVPYSPFNVTEARLRHLLYPPTPINWPQHFAKWALNLGIITALGFIVFLSAGPVAAHGEIIACTPEAPTSNMSQIHTSAFLGLQNSP